MSIPAGRLTVRFLGCALAALLLAGCAITASQKDLNDLVSSHKGGIVVIGMTSTNYAVFGNFAPAVSVGIVKDDGIVASYEMHWWNPEGALKDGYAILPLPASQQGESYVVMSYSGYRSGNAFPVVCDGQKTQVFRVADGDFVYIANYSVEQVMASSALTYAWHVEHAQDFPAAQARVKSLYPDAADRLRPAHLEERTFQVAKGNAFGPECKSIQ